jgi:hypothetical protein
MFIVKIKLEIINKVIKFEIKFNKKIRIPISGKDRNFSRFFPSKKADFQDLHYFMKLLQKYLTNINKEILEIFVNPKNTILFQT